MTRETKLQQAASRRSNAGGKRKRSSRSGGGSNGERSSAEARSYDTKDRSTAQSVIKKLVTGIKELIIEDANPTTPAALDERLVTYRHNQSLINDENNLEMRLRENANAIEKPGKGSAWKHKHMLSSYRYLQRMKQEKVEIHPDHATQVQQRRWEGGSQFLNELVDRLYGFRKELAFVVYRAACLKNFGFHNCSQLGTIRREKVLEMILDGLRYIPITICLQSQVILPPAYLSYTQLEYQEVCSFLKLGNFKGLDFTNSELAEVGLEVSLSILIAKRGGLGELQTFEKNGVQFLTDTIANPQVIGLDGQQLTKERGRAASLMPTEGPGPQREPSRNTYEARYGGNSTNQSRIAESHPGSPLLSPPTWRHDANSRALFSAGWPRDPTTGASIDSRECFSSTQSTVTKLSPDSWLAVTAHPNPPDRAGLGGQTQESSKPPINPAQYATPLQLLANMAGRSQSAAQLMHPPAVVSASDPTSPAATEPDTRLPNGSRKTTGPSMWEIGVTRPQVMRLNPLRLEFVGDVSMGITTSNSRPAGAGNFSLPGWTYFPIGCFGLNQGDVVWVGDIRVGTGTGIPVVPSDITNEASAVSSELSRLDQIMPVANHSGNNYIPAPIYRTMDVASTVDGLEQPSSLDQVSPDNLDNFLRFSSLPE
ncbi:hypothetical protein B0T26DRAFT_438729 [Lasiosphaeria miniovina]|uniref:Uncharacterized protein n=1 Tax=Lasiosphaeria miniovina TaxID=1954250 RepID=A0AA40DLR6_9PEZI|nr:uncharacterized protein B0T26DRAFT_438729 [Lasiosphaeria miniovina]KAK0705921.1 hypothetical protein B0T26DRAFT_438729 [Lasiosphaeria miniovina]